MQCRGLGIDPWSGNQISGAATKSSRPARKTEGPWCRNQGLVQNKSKIIRECSISFRSNDIKYSSVALLVSHSAFLVLKVQDLHSLLVLQELGKRCDPQRHQPGLFSRAQMTALMGQALAPWEGGTTCSGRKPLKPSPGLPPSQSTGGQTFFLRS